MIRLGLSSGGNFVFSQGLTSPCVYLDNWAIRNISSSPELSKRFIKTLLDKDGTLALSWVNLFEIPATIDPLQLEAIESFIAAISPHLIFIESDPSSVVKKEDEALGSEAGIGPHLDNGLLDFFATLRRTSVNPLSGKELIEILKSPTVVEKFGQMKGKFMGNITQLLEQVRKKRESDPQFKAALKLPVSGPEYQRATRYIYQEALNHLYRGDEPMTVNDWLDFFHTIVPLSYCDLVLLDKRWFDLATRIINRLRLDGKLAAQCFSPRTMEEFWKVFASEFGTGYAADRLE